MIPHCLLTLPPSHSPILPFILSTSLSPTLPLTLSPSHPFTLPPTHPLTLFPSLPLPNPLTLSPSHPISLPFTHSPLRYPVLSSMTFSGFKSLNMMPLLCMCARASTREAV